MKLKPPSISVTDDDPFSEDKLGRKESAHNLTTLIRSQEGPFVLSIDAGWGRGKTTFLRMWTTALKNDGFFCVTFSAWECDFTDDPLIAFVGELEATIRAELKGGKLKQAEQLLTDAKKLAAKVGKRMLYGAIKYGTSGVVDIEAISKAKSPIERRIEEKITHFESDKKILEDFRNSLGDLVRVLTGTDEAGKKPVVFCIDELDRCRPTYAVELLERLKHLFNVRGLVFVLALDKEQLAESVKTLYGGGMKAEGYLRRFIDLEYRLPEPRDGITFAAHLFDIFGLQDFFHKRFSVADREEQLLIDTFGLLSQRFGLSLREQEQCFARLIIALRLIGSHGPLFANLLAALLILKFALPDLYIRYIEGRAEAQEVLDAIGQGPHGHRLLYSPTGVALEAFLVGGLCGPQDCLLHAQRYATQGSETAESGTQRATEIGTMLQVLGEHHRAYLPVATYLSKKIEITDQFT